MNLIDCWDFGVKADYSSLYIFIALNPFLEQPHFPQNIVRNVNPAKCHSLLLIVLVKITTAKLYDKM